MKVFIVFSINHLGVKGDGLLMVNDFSVYTAMESYKNRGVSYSNSSRFNKLINFHAEKPLFQRPMLIIIDFKYSDVLKIGI